MSPVKSRGDAPGPPHLPRERPKQLNGVQPHAINKLLAGDVPSRPIRGVSASDLDRVLKGFEEELIGLKGVPTVPAPDLTYRIHVFG